MGDHLHHRTLQGQLATRVDGDHHKTHVGDAGVGYQPFDVGLGKGHDGTVDDTDQAKHHGVGSKFGGRLGEERQGKTQQTVGGGFEQNTG